MASNEKLAEVFAVRVCKEAKHFCLAYEDVEKAAFQMAEWKDGHPKISSGKVLQLRRRAYKKGYDKAIEKACEWLKENLTLYVSVEPKGWEGYKLLIEEEELTTELKKAMELKP